MNPDIEPIEEIMEIEPAGGRWKYAAVAVAVIIFIGAGYVYLFKNGKNGTAGYFSGSLDFISSVSEDAFSNIFKNGESGEKLVESINLNADKNQIAGKSENKTSNVFKQNPFTANIIDSGSVLNKSNQVPASKQNNNASQHPEVIESPANVGDSPIKQPVDSGEEKTKTAEVVGSVVSIKDCPFNVSEPPAHQKVLINEVAWMGGGEVYGLSSNDEWIELKNISVGEINLSSFQLLDQGGQIKVKFSDADKIPAGGFYLLERTDDASVPDLTADGIYTGALSNSNEGLRLFDNECVLMDEVSAGPEWPAGDAAARRTMERGFDLSWHAYNGEAVNNIFGTPKKENSTSMVVSSGTIGGAVINNQQQVISPVISPVRIIISEIQTKGGTGESDNEFVEIYNPGDAAVDLSALPLKFHIRNSNGKDGNKPLTFINNVISAKGYFLIGPASGYNSSASFDATYSVSSGNKLVDNGGVYISKNFSADVDVFDKLGWGKQPSGGFETLPAFENPGANESISRKSEIDTNNNANDFIKSKPTPKNSGTVGGFISPES
jgi:hypothetical protein